MNIPKFRAWYKVNKKMYDVLTLDIIDKKVLIENNEDKEKPLRGYVKISEVELMQSTGLKDKSGAEIFEGDIFTHKNNHKFVVKWDEDRFVGLDNKRNGDGYCCYISSCDKSGNSTIEVIGNIYENSELMERV